MTLLPQRHSSRAPNGNSARATGPVGQRQKGWCIGNRLRRVAHPPDQAIDLLTILIPGAEVPIHSKDVSVHEPFAGSDKPSVPLVAYGFDAGDHYAFVGKADLANRSLGDIKREAFANIEKYAAVWEPITRHVLTASGKDFSAEKILSKQFLIEAQHRLNAKQILVGVPRRTVIYAADGGAPQVALDQFYRVFRKTYDDDSFGNAPITNLLFEYRDGELVVAKAIGAKE